MLSTRYGYIIKIHEKTYLVALPYDDTERRLHAFHNNLQKQHDIRMQELKGVKKEYLDEFFEREFVGLIDSLLNALRDLLNT